jgi:hypothetical protein
LSSGCVGDHHAQMAPLPAQSSQPTRGRRSHRSRKRRSQKRRMSNFCARSKSSKEPKGELEELKGEKKLKPPLPKLNEDERELEYQQMIDKLNNTLSAALARGERRRRR